MLKSLYMNLAGGVPIPNDEKPVSFKPEEHLDAEIFSTPLENFSKLVQFMADEEVGFCLGYITRDDKNPSDIQIQASFTKDKHYEINEMLDKHRTKIVTFWIIKKERKEFKESRVILSLINTSDEIGVDHSLYDLIADMRNNDSINNKNIYIDLFSADKMLAAGRYQSGYLKCFNPKTKEFE